MSFQLCTLNFTVVLLKLGLYGYTAYSASKYALRGFAESLHAEVLSTLLFLRLNFVFGFNLMP